MKFREDEESQARREQSARQEFRRVRSSGLSGREAEMTASY